MAQKYTALEIRTPDVVEIIKAIDPTIGELDYEKDLHNNFYVLNFPEEGKNALVPVETFYNSFDHIENGVFLNLKKFIVNE